MFSYIVHDLWGEPLKAFKHKKEAEWFIINRPDCKIVATGFKQPPIKSDYEIALETCEPCLI
tara:strand:+ start:262 stop:447 length:186 start_codon:yes stop_codon:yes gene_type:complete